MDDAILDLRPPARFESGHRAGAVNIPLEELKLRMHELPPSGSRLTLFDEDPARVEAACALLQVDRWQVVRVSDPDWPGLDRLETGPSASRLWQPHPFLVEALPIVEREWGGLAGRRAFDLACGSGRDAVYLALREMDVEAIDILPDALERAADLARRIGVPLKVRCADLEAGASLNVNCCDLALVFNFLHRPLLAQIREAIVPGGFIVYETFLKASRDAYGKPSRDTHLLNPGELAAAFADWQLLVSREGPSGPRRIAAGIVARKPA